MGEWTKGRIRLDRTRAGRAIVSECNRTIAAAHLLGGSHTEAEADANAERIIACWNAMFGVKDPEMFMDDLRELLSDLSACFDNKSDLQDGDYGTQEPNAELRHYAAIEALLKRIGG